jgi:hypothetical protein
MLQYAEYNPKKFFDEVSHVTLALACGARLPWLAVPRSVVGENTLLARRFSPQPFYYNTRDENNFQNPA